MGFRARRADRKRAAEELRKLSRAVEQSSSIVVITDTEGTTEYVNPRFTEVTGFSAGEATGANPRVVGSGLQSREFYDGLWATLLAGQEWRGEFINRKKTGELYWELASISPIRDKAGTISHFVKVAEDITDRVRAEEALRERTEELDKRVRELNCLYGISNLVERPGTSLEEILQGTVDLVPPASDNPQATFARITLEGQEYASEGFTQAACHLAYPLLVHGEQIGTIEVCFPDERGGGDLLSRQDPGGLLLAISQRLGRIIERFRAEEEIKEARAAAELARREEEERRREAERRRVIAESLGEVLSALNSNQPLDHVLGTIAAQARSLLGPKAAGIYTMEADAGSFTVRASRGLLLTYAAGTNIPIGRGTLNQAIASGQVVVVPNLGAQPSGEAGVAGTGNQEELPGPWASVYKSLLAVPIAVEERVHGGMLLYYADQRAFSDEEVDLASMFGDQVALAIENARLRDAIRLSAVTEERDRLARDLHDSVTQTLFSASLLAEAVPHVWERDPEEGRRGLLELRELTRGALAEMRTMLLELRPAALIEKPLGELLRHLTEAVTGRSRIPMDLRIRADWTQPPDVQIALYRIAQEALNNVSKHSSASHASVDLFSQPQQVRISIRDDGRGFDPSDVRPDLLGLGIMRDRAAGIGAALEIQSRPGHGTELQVHWGDHDGGQS